MSNYIPLIVVAGILSIFSTKAFVPSTGSSTSRSSFLIQAKPKRLEENVEGVVYVNDKCINCAACSNFAPSVFGRAQSSNYHIVHHQPSNPQEILDARAAMAACPVAAIRSETLAQRRHGLSESEKKAAEQAWTEVEEHLSKQMALSPKVNGLEMPFPRPLLLHEAGEDNNDNKRPDYKIYNVGHHNDRSFGATPYLLQGMVDSKQIWIMVDSPRHGKSAVDAVKQLTGPDGPDYLMLTHVDDTADHGKWAEEFPSMKRIFHAGDTGRYNWLRDETLNDVEILLPLPQRPSPPSVSDKDDDEISPFHAYSLDGKLLPDSWLKDFASDDNHNNVVILHTPGHSPGSITLWRKPYQDQPGVIFTGDHYAYTTRDGGGMTGFPRYGNNLDIQATSMRNLLRLEWDIVAPGHGHPRDYTQVTNDDKDELKAREMEEAISNLRKH